MAGMNQPIVETILNLYRFDDEFTFKWICFYTTYFVFCVSVCVCLIAARALIRMLEMSSIFCA